MPIHLPHYMPPFGDDPYEWRAYIALQEAGLEYIAAWRDTIGVFSLFSRKKGKRLKDARGNYDKKREAYLGLFK